MKSRFCFWVLLAVVTFSLSQVIGRNDGEVKNCMQEKKCDKVIVGAETQQSVWPYKDATPDTEIQYINEDAPSIPVVPYKGKAYEDLVPDTFDIAERAKLAINVLTCATNPNQDYEQYFSVYMGDPLRMSHNASDWCTPKYMEALTLLRLVTGTDSNVQVDQTWQKVNLKSLGPDGLYYFPIIGKPWYARELWWAGGIAMADGSIYNVQHASEEEAKEGLDTYAKPHASRLVEESGISQFTHPQPCGRMLNVMGIYYMRGGNPIWIEKIKKMVDRLNELAVCKGDYCYFPGLYYAPNGKFDKDDPNIEMPTGMEGGEVNGRLGQGLALCYKLTGYKPALELARKLSNYIRHHSEFYGKEGEWTGPLHFHHHTHYAINMLDYAVVAEDKELIDFVRKVYEYGKSPKTGCSSLLGFFPEWISPLDAPNPYPTAEGCEIAEMIVLALKLSAANAGDYYGDAERWVRNHYAESQLTPDKVALLIQEGKRRGVKKEILYNETTDRVGERNVGAFSSWSLPNEWWGEEPPTETRKKNDNLIMHCCTSNGTRAIYYIWEHILDYCPTAGHLKVNMLLNRASEWADVYSYIPYEGQVDIKMKKNCDKLSVHAPEWVQSGSSQMSVSINGSPQKVSWDKRYIVVENVKAGDRVEVRFPIEERFVHEKILRNDYEMIVKGNTVVHIDPPGRICPIYQRGEYRSDKVRWVKVKRFVSDEKVSY